MILRRLLEKVRRDAKFFCHHYDEERNVQCKEVPTRVFENMKTDARSYWCEVHCPEREHYADSVEKMDGALALEAIGKHLASLLGGLDEDVPAPTIEPQGKKLPKPKVTARKKTSGK